MVIGQPCLTHHSIPGESRSFALSRFWSVILSPGTTSARARPPTSAHASASMPTPAARQPSFFAMVGSPLLVGEPLLPTAATLVRLRASTLAPPPPVTRRLVPAHRRPEPGRR